MVSKKIFSITVLTVAILGMSALILNAGTTSAASAVNTINLRFRLVDTVTLDLSTPLQQEPIFPWE